VRGPADDHDGRGLVTPLSGTQSSLAAKQRRRSLSRDSNSVYAEGWPWLKEDD